MFRRLILTAACGIAVAAFSATAAQAGCSIAGRYMAHGHLTGASGGYKGEVIIKDEGGGCYVRWLPPNTSEGTGLYLGGVLTVNYVLGGKEGVVRYEMADNGVLEGSFWPKGHPTDIQGTETLTPLD